MQATTSAVPGVLLDFRYMGLPFAPYFYQLE
jgi:hypothetical protein